MAKTGIILLPELSPVGIRQAGARAITSARLEEPLMAREIGCLRIVAPSLRGSQTGFTLLYYCLELAKWIPSTTWKRMEWCRSTELMIRDE